MDAKQNKTNKKAIEDPGSGSRVELRPCMYEALAFCTHTLLPDVSLVTPGIALRVLGVPLVALGMGLVIPPSTTSRNSPETQ